MRDFFQKYGFSIAVTFLVLIIGAALAVKFWPQKEEKFKIMKPAPEFRLLNTDNETVTLSDSDGKVRVVYFFYTSCPDVCQPTTYMLSKVQERLIEKGYWGTKAVINSITFDPEVDTAEHLKEFSERFIQEPGGWNFLRGDEKEIKELAEKYDIGVFKDKNGLFTHSNMVILVDKAGNIRNYYYASNAEFDPIEIADDMIRLSKEK